MPHAPDLVGCALDGRYELHELIGEGTFGRVYRGYDRRLAREVAIKVIKPWWAEDPEWAESFGREAQLLARVSDPGIVQIYDVGPGRGGPLLRDRAGRGREPRRAPASAVGGCSPWEACEIAEQLCRALEHAHAEQIVHRDIKPANVLLSRHGRVKVGDLGIARLAEAAPPRAVRRRSSALRATWRPSRRAGSRSRPATDVYSAGIVLYEMLAGHPPFNGDSAVEIALRHVQAPVPPLPPGTPWSLEEIVVAGAGQGAGRAVSERGGDGRGSSRRPARAPAGARPGARRLEPTRRGTPGSDLGRAAVHARGAT